MVDGFDIDSLIQRLGTAGGAENDKAAEALREIRDEAIRESPPVPLPPPPPEAAPPAIEAPPRFIESPQPVRPVQMLRSVQEHFGNPTIDVLKTSSWGWFPDASVIDGSWINIVRVHYEYETPPRTYGDIWYCIDGGIVSIEAWQDEGVDIRRIQSF